MDKIIEHLYLGSHEDLIPYVLDHYHINVVICVLEDPHCLKTMQEDGREWIHIPVLKWADENDPIWDSEDCGEHANPATLDVISGIIEEAILLKRNVLVHCGAGLERSPLTVAWYLRNKLHISLDEAYKIIKSKRQVFNRVMWLPPKYRRDY